MIKFPSIDQFRQVIRNVKNKASFSGLDENGSPIYKQVIFPTLMFTGSVKLHGTNASVRQNKKGEALIFQSRERIITPLDDNAGFATAMYAKGDKLVDYMHNVRNAFNITDDVTLTVYGEWCGGNIQKGVALNQVDKMFVVFAVRENIEEDTKWYRCNDPRFAVVKRTIVDSDEAKIYSINDFGQWNVEVDFNFPEKAQDEFHRLTMEVEAECPAGAYFGVKGIGEGLVWHCSEPGWEDGGYVFKTKGSAHSVSKVKVIAAVDVEKVNKIRELVDVIMTENRMAQMLQTMKDRDGLDASPQNLGTFIKTCMQDAIKEEMDTIVQNGFEVKDFTKAAAAKVRTWFLSLGV